VLTASADLSAYECDGFTIAKTKPNVVVFPTTTEHIVGIVKVCNEMGVSFLARGAGTSLAGGCVIVGGGVMIALARMKRILEVNTRDRYAVVEPGVVNVWLTNALKPHGFHYAPDRRVQLFCRRANAANRRGWSGLAARVIVSHNRAVRAQRRRSRPCTGLAARTGSVPRERVTAGCHLLWSSRREVRGHAASR